MSTTEYGNGPSTVHDGIGKGGKLIAIEGDHDTIATQLRLLPVSQKILILPAIAGQLEAPADDPSPFQARCFVQQIHTLFSNRTEQARSFLASSEDGQPRLVFTNGGSITARAACITRIAESMDGDIVKAEEIYNNIVKDGVAGLMRPEPTISSEELSESTTNETQVEKETESDDPSVRAMKAAEALDREAGHLDDDEPVDYSAEALHGDRIISDTGSPGEGQLKDAKHSAEKDQGNLIREKESVSSKREIIFTAEHGEEIRRTTIVVPQRSSSLWRRRNTLSTERPYLKKLTPSRMSRPSSGQVLRYSLEDDCELSSLGDEAFPTTPGVEYGEACLVDMQSPSSEISVRKIRSVDRFFPSLFQDPQQSMYPQVLKHSVSHSHIRTRQSKIAAEQFQYFPTLPRTTFVRASQTTINKRSPTESEVSKSCASSFRTTTRVFVDRGTDAEDRESQEDNTSAQINAETPEVVLPVVEDLIIYLDSQSSDKLLKSIISNYEGCQFPRPPDINQENRVDNINRQEAKITIARTHIEKDAMNNNFTSKVVEAQAPPTKNRVDSAIQMGPTTPGLKPTLHGFSEPVVNLSYKNTTTALELQNSLRQLLNVHFPASCGYSQHLFPTTPDLERLWKPVFRTDDGGSDEENGRTVDQILALGCEPSVKSDFFSQISGYVERLGTKKSGLSRSGKIDIRYFMSNVAQNLATPSDPLSDPEALACLLIPQLETYLASNSSTQLLILYYTTEHLATILALKRLLGNEILKVAGVLDTLSSDPPSRPRTPLSSAPNPLSNEATAARPISRRQQSLQQQIVNTTNSRPSSSMKKQSISQISPSTSFSRADFLIPSTATDAEIATFLSSIWKCLMQRSNFYTPEPEPKPVVIQTPSPPPVASNTRQYPSSKPLKDSTAASIHASRILERTTNAETSYPPSSFKSPKSNQPTTNYSSDKASRLTGTTSHSISTPNLNRKYATSIASSMRTTASERGRREDREWENFYIAEEDSEDDAYDKMILGRGFAKIVPEVRRPVDADGNPVGGQKRGTKKALKWLGLA